MPEQTTVGRPNGPDESRVSDSASPFNTLMAPAATAIGRRAFLKTSAAAAGSLIAGRALGAEHELRTWTDATGKFTIEARYVAFDYQGTWNVTLQRADGSRLDVRVNILSNSDKEYVYRARGVIKDPQQPAAAKETKPAVTAARGPCSYTTLVGTPIDFAARHCQLGEILSQLSEKGGFNVHIDSPASQKVGQTIPKVYLPRFSTGNFAGALDQATRQAGLGFSLHREVVLVMQASTAARHFETLVYLCPPHTSGLSAFAQTTSGTRGAITSAYGQNSWVREGEAFGPNNSGPGIMIGHPAGNRAYLLVHHASSIHAAMQDSNKAGVMAVDHGPLRRPYLPSPLQQPLGAACSVDFKNTPLAAAAQELTRISGVPVKIDSSVGSAPITLALSNIPFDTAVEYTAMCAGLQWTADDNGITLSAPSRQLPLLQATYSLPEVPAQHLAQVVAMCQPTSWSAAGGRGTIEPSSNGAVVAYNTLAVHQQVDEVVETLRYAATRGPIDSPYRWISDVKSTGKTASGRTSRSPSAVTRTEPRR